MSAQRLACASGPIPIPKQVTSDRMNATSQPILSATGLTKEFRGFLAVKDVNLTVREGTIHALIGPNGAGQTTVFNLLTKFLTPSRGEIRFRGTEITALKPAEVARMGLVRSFQISAVFPHLTLLDNVRIALQRPSGLATQFWRPASTLSALDHRALELIEAVNLSPYANLTASELSYGRKRALEIATTLALDPAMLLLDEPMAGMGHEDIGRISDLIRRIAQSRTVLMVEHNLNVVSDLCDFVTVLARGEILAEGPYASVSADPRVREAYMGTDHG
jgi:branched-chain amino acid transport system ATP-binding protein